MPDIVLNGEAWIVYKHGQPHCVRDRNGVICTFNSVQKYSHTPEHEQRYIDECNQRTNIARFICNALNERAKNDVA